MKKISIITILFMMAFAANAQKLSFVSPEFEEAIREYLELEEGEDILQTQLNAIEVLNLKGKGIDDIADVIYLTNVTDLDLSGNHITDLSPLLVLENLRTLNLSNNGLEDVDQLLFTSSESLTVNVGHNYIEDFSRFYTPTECRLTLLGIDTQSQKDATFVKVTQLYANTAEGGKTYIYYSGQTNATAALSLQYDSQTMPAILDGNLNTVLLPGKRLAATRVVLADSDERDYTYVVPTVHYAAAPSETKTLETGLPDNFRIDQAMTRHGSVTIDGTNLVYTAPDRKVPDVISFSYYQGAKFRGYGRLLAGLQYGDANGDGSVSVTDIAMVVNKILSLPLSSGYVEEGADANYDGSVTVTDIGVIVDTILGNDGSANARRMTPDSELEPQ